LELLGEEINNLTKGCPFERKTIMSEQDLGFHSPSSTVSVRTKYYFDTDTSRKKQCTNPVTKELEKIELINLVFDVEDLGFGKQIILKLGNDRIAYRDMKYIRNRLENVSGLSEFFKSVFDQDDLISMLCDPGTGITLMSGKALSPEKPLPFVLKYYKGWGDCMAGCIYRHYWTVQVTPKLESDRTTNFDILLQKEEGPPL